MGSVSHSVARHTHCPVLVVRDSGERMPKDHERIFLLRSFWLPTGRLTPHLQRGRALISRRLPARSFTLYTPGG